MVHYRCVLVQQWLTLCAVGNHRIGVGGEFDVRRKAAAASAHDSCLTDLIDEVHLEFRTPSLSTMRVVAKRAFHAWRQRSKKKRAT
jgi:hypothetical protein